METRSSMKRRWKSSPDKKKARTSLDFGHLENTPPRKKFRAQSQMKTFSNGNSSENELSMKQEDSFGIKSFYGGREKKHFPHSPGRRKAIGKVLSKLSDDNRSSESDEDLKKKDASKTLSKLGKYTDSDDHNKQRPVLRQSSRKQNIVTEKGKSYLRSQPDSLLPTSPRLATTADAVVVSTPKQKIGHSDQVTPVQNVSSNSGKKFFKHKSPISADKAVGSVIVRQGFNLKFIPKKSLSMLKPQNKTKGKKDEKKKKNAKNPAKAVTKEQRNEHDKSISCDSTEQRSLVQNSSDSAFVSGASEESSQSYKNDCQGKLNKDLVLKGTPKKQVAPSQSQLGTPSVTPSDSLSSLRETNDIDDVVYSTPSKITRFRKENLTTQTRNSITCSENYDGSADLFSTTSGSSCQDPPSVQTSPSSESSTSISISSLRSGPTLRNSPDKRFYPIFTSKSTPKQQTRLQELSRKRNSPRTSPRMKFIDSKDDQMMLDAGQKKYGATQCEVCGMVYSHAEPTDETTHAKFHHSLLNALKFPGWKKERVVQEFPDDGSRIIVVIPGDQKCATKKVEEINKIMSQELGFSEHGIAFRSGCKAFLLISDDKKIMGCCMAESVTKGYKVIPDSQPSQEPQHRPWCCQSEPQPASVGINRIWVHNQHRRKGVASKLLDSVRHWFEYGVIIDKTEVAFSDPTPDGKLLATNYFGSSSFLVYKYG